MALDAGQRGDPCILILIGRFDLPESPRWLLRKGRVKECEAMMIKLFGEPVVFDEEAPQETRFLQLFNRRHFPFVLFVAAIWTCQVIPMFAIYTFGPQIVGLLGLGAGKSAALGNVVISLCFMLGCIPPMFWLNSAGRRPLLIGSFIMMTLALAVLGLIPDMGAWLVVLAFAVYAFSRGTGKPAVAIPKRAVPYRHSRVCRRSDYVLKPHRYYCFNLGAAGIHHQIRYQQCHADGRRNFADWPACVHRFRPGNARSDAGANQSNDDSQ